MWHSSLCWLLHERKDWSRPPAKVFALTQNCRYITFTGCCKIVKAYVGKQVGGVIMTHSTNLDSQNFYAANILRPIMYQTVSG